MINRLTKAYGSGKVTLDAENFKPLLQETIDAEISASPLLKTVTERLYEYENEVTYCSDCVYSEDFTREKVYCKLYGLKHKKDFCSDGG